MEPNFNLYAYHWIWYLVGFFFAPRLTMMILVTIHFKDVLPVHLLVWGWILMIAANSLEVQLLKWKKGTV